jgi:hypothetical protein
MKKAILIMISLSQFACLTGIRPIYVSDSDSLKSQNADTYSGAVGCGSNITSLRNYDSTFNWLSLASGATTIGVGTYAGVDGANSNAVMISTITVGLIGITTQMLSTFYSSETAADSYREYWKGMEEARNGNHQEAQKHFDKCRGAQ